MVNEEVKKYVETLLRASEDSNSNWSTATAYAHRMHEKSMKEIREISSTRGDAPITTKYGYYWPTENTPKLTESMIHALESEGYRVDKSLWPSVVVSGRNFYEDSIGILALYYNFKTHPFRLWVTGREYIDDVVVDICHDGIRMYSNGKKLYYNVVLENETIVFTGQRKFFAYSEIIEFYKTKGWINV